MLPKYAIICIPLCYHYLGLLVNRFGIWVILGCQVEKSPLPRFCFHFWVSKCIFSLRYIRVYCLLLYVKSSPPVRLHSLTFQADCGSIKGAGFPAEDGTEHYLPCGKYPENLITANAVAETLSHDDSN